MTNQKGVTLLELLLAVSIMGVIIIPLTMACGYLLQTYRDVGCKNELQHEAQLIMEYLSSQIRAGAYWDAEHQKLLLQQEGGSPQTVLRYDEFSKSIVGSADSMVLSNNVEFFEVTPIPAPSQRRFVVDMRMKHPACDDHYKVTLRLNERDTVINYTSSGE
jgi:prepilin-type N-terminal cleavage/methylation domain-containing protein